MEGIVMTKRVVFIVCLLSLVIASVYGAAAAPSAFKKAQADIIGKMGEIPKPSRAYRIGALEITLANPFWVTMKDGYVAAAKDFGFKVDVLAAPSESDTAGQLNFLETMVDKKYDALCVSPITPFNLIPGVEKATRKNVPVICVGTWLDEEAAKEAGAKVAALYSSDFEGQGYLGAKYIVDQLKKVGGGKVAIIEGLPGASQGEARKAGALKAFKESSAIKVVSTQPGNWDRNTALNITTNLIQAHPDLKGIFCANDTMALAAVEALKAVGKKAQVIVVGVDYIPEANASMKAKELDASVAQSPYLFGYVGAVAALKSLENSPLPKGISIPIALVSQSNLDQYIDWK
ncbi:MAG TPA: monosaccharide-transporting ATPase [Firmicutes bacterium]|nr:monosaccharide-transporting ATPase [Bacillota bacterium]